MNKKTIILNSVISGILLSLAWSGWFSGLVLFIAIIPLLFVEKYLYRNRNKFKSRTFFLYLSLSFTIWNLLSIFWIYNATIPGAIGAIIINTTLLSVAIWLFHVTHRRLGDKFGYFSLVIYWLAFEHFYLNAEISFPWLNLGNGLAKDILFIQWYEYTGTFGGTLWVIIINILLFKIINNYLAGRTLREQIAKILFTAGFIFIPMVISTIIFYSYKEAEDPYDIVIIQPNIDPYNEKFGGLSNYEQLSIILHLADSLVDENTDYVIGPETSINDYIWENTISENSSIKRVKQFIEKHQNVKFVAGITSYKRYQKGEKLSPTARKFTGVDSYYDVYNTGMQMDSTENIQLYHKSQLVVGVEKMPYPHLFKFLENIIIDLGGTTGSYGTQKERSTLNEPRGDLKAATLICYESIFGEYVTRYIHNGANIIFVITNDGWWGNTSGYKQHLTYSSIRAIETRRSIARSANTGISCFINQQGEIKQPTEWWVPDVIKSTLNLNEKITFYVKYGDYIGRTSDFFSIILLAYTLVNILIARKPGKS
ncbi:MAG: apolipoprotein N-acyltransferase [Bacteroidales bacterium]|nr:apolipoprotein N-acyltransferase [Bacteroidales bacterium]